MSEKVKKMRRQLHDLEERITIQHFLKDKNLFNTDIPISSVAPDYVVENPDGHGLWIEETSVFNLWTKQVDVSQYEYKCSTDINSYCCELRQKIIKAINKKNEKQNYTGFTSLYGKGILLVRIDDPCFHSEIHLEKVINHDDYKKVELGFFHAIYLFDLSFRSMSGPNCLLLLGKDIPPFVAKIH
jgi:hypothetical protein